MTGLLDHRGNPIRKEMLTREVAAPQLSGVRSPISGYPGDGLNPVRLAQLMRAADHGNPQAYFELAEQIEERDLHYVGVLGTRKRSVSQIDITVDAASDAAHDVAMADMVREWLDRDELADEMFDILDAVGKGISCTEIIWDSSEGQWRPLRLERVDQRYLTFDRRDLNTPMLRGGASGTGPDEYLEPFKFIDCRIKAKSGIPVRSGIARLQAWNWMFKAFTLRDWAIFVQTYGQPVRIGTYHPGASDADRRTLFEAVANIAGDCAAIIPEGMKMEFKESANVGPGSELFENRADWLDRQTSKAVLGQTGTTDQKGGGLGDGGNKVHERVAEDIETADCKAVSAPLNRDLVRPWVTLEFGPQKRFPKLRVARPKREDLAGLVNGLKELVPLGLEVEQSQIRDKFGITEPAPGAKLLRAPIAVSNVTAGQLAMQARQAPKAAATFPPDAIAHKLVRDTAPEVARMAEAIEAMLDQAKDLDEFREMLFAAYPDIDTRQLGALIAPALVAASAAGASDLEDESA